MKAEELVTRGLKRTERVLQLQSTDSEGTMESGYEHDGLQLPRALEVLQPHAANDDVIEAA